MECPLDCEFLQQAREHDKLPPLDPDKIPNRDIRLSEELLEEHPELTAFLARALAHAALSTGGAVDYDLRQALEALITTYRTLNSGVYYESVPTNPLAAAIYRSVQQALAEFRRQETEQLGLSRTRDAQVMANLLFFQRVELDRNNGRPKGRAAISAIIEFYGAGPAPSTMRTTSSLILP